VGSTTRNTS